jgi:F0F1-type ATP synthase membrane subunit b/b'
MMRNVAKFAQRLAATFFVIAALAAPAFAAEGASPDAADSPAGLIFRWLNFVLVFGTLAYVLARWGGPYFRARGAETGRAIREATAAKADAERELRQIEDQIAHLDSEIVRLRDESTQEAAAEAQRQVESGQREIERIDRAAEFEIEASERLVRHQLRSLAAQMAIEAAEKDLRAGLPANAAARAALFQTFVADLGSVKQ